MPVSGHAFSARHITCQFGEDIYHEMAKVHGRMIHVRMENKIKRSGQQSCFCF